MKALLIIDMQAGMLQSATPPRDVDGVVERINAVARALRQAQGLVVFIQHQGPPGDSFAPGASGWQFLPALAQTEGDRVVAKTMCDAFYHTELEALLQAHQVNELYIAGWATDFCVDTTLRAAASREYNITVLSDAHTAADRPHLAAASIIRHHNLTWADLIVPGRPIRVVATETLCAEFSRQ